MKLLRAILVLTLAACAVWGQGQAPAAADPTADYGSIAGMVVNSRTGEPVKRAHITFASVGGTSGGGPGAAGPAGTSEPVRGITDSGGKFRLDRIPSGTYRVLVSRDGFVRSHARSPDPSREPSLLTLQPKQNVADLAYRLAPASVLAGVVLDEDNAPMAGVRIQCLEYAYRRTGRELESAGITITDDRGQYRISGLTPGHYYVRATYIDSASLAGPVRGAIPEGYPSLYYPGVIDAGQAADIPLQESEERPGVDFKLAPAHVAHVQGQVRTADGRLAGKDVLVSLAPRMSAGLSGRTPARVGVDGSFRIDGVTAGSYMLTASAGGSGGTVAHQVVEVGEADLDNVRLFLTARTDLKGRVRVEGDRKISLGGIPVLLAPLDNSAVMLAGAGFASIDAEGSLVFRSVTAGDYRVLIDSLPEDAFLKQVKLGDRPAEDGVLHLEAAGIPVELLLSTAGGRVDGSLTGEQDKPAPDATVVLVPDATRRARGDLYRIATSDQYGHFSIRGIPPGDYKLFAWSDELEPWSWLDPAVLAPYENQGKSVSVEQSSRNKVDLKTIERAP
jgi:hypothetical protein